jgi:hypothetical protein
VADYVRCRGVSLNSLNGTRENHPSVARPRCLQVSLSPKLRNSDLSELNIEPRPQGPATAENRVWQTRGETAALVLGAMMTVLLFESCSAERQENSK